MRAGLGFLLACFVWFSAAFAQTNSAIDYQLFDRFADAVEISIEKDELNNAGFEGLRASLVDWRDDLLAARNVNGPQIEALQAQLDALGPAPADGTPEAASIANRREELTTALETAREPRLQAIEAHARADALIGQIDATLRGRQTDALLELEQTPLDPSLWGGAVTALLGVVSNIRSEFTDIIASRNQAQFWQRAGLSAILLIAAIGFIFRGPRWIESALSRIENSTSEHASVVYGFLVSFASVVAAMVGVSLINASLISTGLLGDTGRAVALGINAAILAIAVARWLGGRTFPARSSIPSALNLEAPQRAAGRRQAASLGFLTGLLSLQGIVSSTVDFERGQLAVLTFPIFVLMGLVLFRLGGLVSKGGKPVEDETPTFANRVARLLGRAVQLVGVLAPMAAAIGFFNLARGVLYPLSLSLALIAFLMALHYVLRAAYAMFRRLDHEEAKQALAPVLVSLGVTLSAIPAFALIWGARNSDLDETWERFKAGITVGDAAITPGAFLTFAIVFAIGFGLTRLVQGTLRASVLPRTKMDKGGQNAITSGLGYLGVTIAAIAGITAAGINLSSFAIIIGALGVGIGFGLQNIVNNFVSGIILLIERPIGEGDWVEVNGQMGIVKAISVRSTRIQTFDRTDVIVPNGDLISGTVTNWTRGDSIGRIIVPVGVAYGTDTRKVENILKEIAEANPLVSVNPPPAVVFQGFGADSMDFEIRAILSDINYGLSVKSDMNHEIARRFAEEGIEIPFAQRDIWLRNPESLQTKPSEPRPPSQPIDPMLGGMDVDD